MRSEYKAGAHEERKEIRGLIETLKKVCGDWTGPETLDELGRRIDMHVDDQGKTPGGLGRK